jgi:hypothetical protein
MLKERLRRAGWVIVDPILDAPTVCRRRLEALALGWRRARWNLAAAARERAWSMRPTRRRSIGLRSTLLNISAGSRRAAWLVADAILDVPAACRRRFQPIAAASQRARANAIEAARVVGWTVADSVAWMDARRGRIAGLASVPLVSALALAIGLSSGPAESSPLVGPPAVVQDASPSLSPAPAAVPVERRPAAPRRTQVVRHATAPRPGLGRSSIATGAKSPVAARPGATGLSARSPRAASAPVAHRTAGARPAGRPKAATPVATPRPRRTPPRPRATPPAAPARPTPAAPVATPVAVPAGLPTAAQPPAQQSAQPAADQTRQPSQAQPSTPTPPAPANEGTGPVTTPPPSSGHADEEDEEDNRWGRRWNQNESRGHDDRDRDGDRDRDRDRRRDRDDD